MLLFVNDGSKDQTLEVINELAAEQPNQISVFDNQPNTGKAEAVRRGMMHAFTNYPDFEYYGYWDADYATPLEELDWYVEMSSGTLKHSMIMGSRVARLGASVQRKMVRHYLGRIFSTLASNILALPVYDTQCGAKLIRRDAVAHLFSEPFLSKWLFDVELLARLKRGIGAETVRNEVLEVPLRVWRDVKGSKIHFTDFLKIPLDLLKIRNHYH